MIPVVIYGPTGCGKTNLLRELERRNLPVIDLEKLARHRGSVFGQINISEEQPPQPAFEESIREQLECFYEKDFIFLEHESLNIGKLRLPDSVIRLYKTGIPVLLQSSLERRVKIILQEYLPADDSLLLQSLEKLQERTGPEFHAVLKKLLTQKHYQEFVKEILTYYDQSKKYNPYQEYSLMIMDEGAAANADALLRWLRNHVVASERTTGSTLS